MAAVVDQEIQQFEVLCKHLYESSNSVERAEAEKALVNFQNSPDALVKCQLLLERGTSSYAQLLAATTLTKLVSRQKSIVISLQQRIQIRNYVLAYLAQRTNLDAHVGQALAQLFARITKLGWMESENDEYVFRNVMDNVGKFLQGAVELGKVGIQLLVVLISEMNTTTSDSDFICTVNSQRKIAISFRNELLYEIFRLSCTLLKTAMERQKANNLDDQSALMNQSLRLAHNCLTFTFDGSSADELSDEYSTIYIPTNWRPVFLEFDTLQLFFDLYNHMLPSSSLSHMALSCLVQMASARRSLFSNGERLKVLTQLVNGVKNILLNPPTSGLGDANNYHEFCRLLNRLKSNYQLGELVLIPSYAESIQLIAKFTVDSIQQMLQVAPNSVHYLLNFWHRMVGSLPFVKATEPHMLDKYTPEVTRAYITTRIDSVGVCIREGMEDPLDDTSLVTQQLEQLSTISRCEFQKTGATIAQLFDQVVQKYQELLQHGRAAAPIDLAIQEGQLSWLVYMIGAIIGGRVSYSKDEDDVIDGELSCRVYQLLQLTDSRLTMSQGGGGSERLELAYLSFLDQFRKMFVGDQVRKAPKVYQRLSTLLGLSNWNLVLNFFARKIMTNLKCWSRSELLLSKTLQLLDELAIDSNVLRKLVKVAEVQYMFNNHTGDHFPFLRPNQSLNSTLRFRTTFYTTLGRLLAIEMGGEDLDKFDTFMAPLTAKMDCVSQLLLANDETTLRGNEEAKWRIIELARDIRGILFGFQNRHNYLMFFDWIFPAYTPVFQRALELWFHDPLLTTPVLKMFAELARNRSQRIHVDVCSPNGFLLFREVSKTLCLYGNRILTLDVPKEQLYPLKLKGISICFTMLSAALSGGYVNFGILRLYGDDALDNALNCFAKLLASTPLSDLMDFPKLSRSYYVLVERLALHHMNFVASLDPNMLLCMLSSISQGLSALDSVLCVQCYSTLDQIVTYLFKQLALKNRNRPQQTLSTGVDERVLQIVEQHPEIFQQMLETVLNRTLYEVCRHEYSMSGPFLGLILLYEEYFGQLRDNIIRNQPTPELQVTMAQRFEALMEGIERNLSDANRERFISNFNGFCKPENKSLKTPATPNAADDSDMMND